MKRLRDRRIRLVLVPVIVVGFASACVKWTVLEMTPNQVVAEKEPGRVRLIMLSGAEFELHDPAVSNGEIVGHPVEGEEAPKSYTLRVAADSVARIEIRETDTYKTILTVTTVLSAVGAAWLFFSFSEWDPPEIKPRWPPA